jgi:hypothetical protein
MLPGSVWQYEETTADGERQTDTVEVLDEQREVMGVETIVVHDVVKDADGEVIEDTFDWFAQDADGNVWYFGEDTTAYDEGTPSREGSWEAGVDGALPGIVMPADPTVSSPGYRQEYLAGEAEDMGQVIAVSGSVTVPFGSFDDVVRTRDWSPLEPEIVRPTPALWEWYRSRRCNHLKVTTRWCSWRSQRPRDGSQRWLSDGRWRAAERDGERERHRHRRQLERRHDHEVAPHHRRADEHVPALQPARGNQRRQ